MNQISGNLDTVIFYIVENSLAYEFHYIFTFRIYILWFSLKTVPVLLSVVQRLFLYQNFAAYVVFKLFFSK